MHDDPKDFNTVSHEDGLSQPEEAKRRWLGYQPCSGVV